MLRAADVALQEQAAGLVELLRISPPPRAVILTQVLDARTISRVRSVGVSSNPRHRRRRCFRRAVSFLLKSSWSIWISLSERGLTGSRL